MVSLADIKNDLPLWPDDVIEIWLLPLANRGPDTGWPPPDPLGTHAWKYIIGGKPISWWSNVVWQLETVDCSYDNLSESTRRIIGEMLAAHVAGQVNAYAALDPGGERFRPLFNYILQHGTFPRPIVTMPIASGLSVLDGNHRISAHALSQWLSDEVLGASNVQRPAALQSAWVGRHSDGETLED